MPNTKKVKKCLHSRNTMINESEIFYDVVKKIKEIGSRSDKYELAEVWEVGDTYTLIFGVDNQVVMLQIGKDNYRLQKQHLFKTESADNLYISKNGMDNLYHDSGLDDMMDAIVHLEQIETVFVF